METDLEIYWKQISDWSRIFNTFHQLQILLNAIVECLGEILEGNVGDETKRNKLIDRTRRSTLNLQRKSSAIPDMKMPSRIELQSDIEKRDAVVCLSKELQVGTKVLVESLSEALGEIAAHPESLNSLEETYSLALSLSNTNQELLATVQEFCRISAHFSTLRTRITNPQLLILSLEQLGLTVKQEAEVRGWRGQTVKADVVAVLKGNYDIGWSRNVDGTFDLITDLWGVALFYDHTELINSINQRYAQNASRE